MFLCVVTVVCDVKRYSLTDFRTKLSARQAALCTGSDEERGLTALRPVSYSAAADDDDDDDENDDANVKVAAMTTYDLPLITPVIKRSHWSKYIPVCSTFSGFSWMRCYSRKRQTTGEEFSDRSTGKQHPESPSVDESSL